MLNVYNCFTFEEIVGIVLALNDENQIMFAPYNNTDCIQSIDSLTVCSGSVYVKKKCNTNYCGSFKCLCNQKSHQVKYKKD